MDLREILECPPLVHRNGRHVWSLSREALRFIERNVHADSVTVETGLGVSTLLFVTRGGEHHCICPGQDEIDRFRSYCREHGVSLDRARFYPENSEQVVPSLKLPEVDLILIDGGHGFPTPFIDWYYLSRHLKPGGYLIVDDTQLWTGRVLRDFLRGDPGWEPVPDDLGTRTAGFRATKPFSCGEWTSQRYVVARSRYTRISQKLREGMRYLSRGEFGGLARKIRSELVR